MTEQAKPNEIEGMKTIESCVDALKSLENVNFRYEPVQTRRIHEWNPMDYALHSTQAVFDFVERKGDMEKTIIFYSDANIQVVLDHTLQDRPLDRAQYNFQFSGSFESWRKIFDEKLSQKAMIDFLRRTGPYELCYGERDKLISNLRKFQFMTEIKGDYQLDENGNVSVMYKETGGAEGIATLPNRITLNIEIFNESQNETELELEFEVIKPKTEQDKLGFMFTCPKLSKYIRDARDSEVTKLKEALPNFMIIAGRQR